MAVILSVVLTSGCGAMAPRTSVDVKKKERTGTDTCTQEGGTSAKPATPSGSSFASTAEPILSKRCYGCHATQAPRFSTPEAAAAIGSKIATAVSTGRMPPGSPLSTADKATVQAWADGGFSTLMLLETTPTYLGTIKSIVDTKCAWCHSANAKPEFRRAPYMTSYELVTKRADKMYEEMGGDEGEEQEMPPRQAPQLADGELQSFAAWLYGGMPIGTPPPAIDTTQGVYYADAVKTLLGRSCVGCHNASGRSPDLSTFDAAVAAADRASERIAAGTMPPSGPLSDADKAVFATWLKDGKRYDKDSTSAPDTSTGTGTGTGPATGTDTDSDSPASGGC